MKISNLYSKTITLILCLFTYNISRAAISCDGTNDQIIIPSTVAIGTTWTFSTWILPSTQAEDYGMLFGDSSGSWGIWYRGSSAGGAQPRHIDFFFSGLDHNNTTALTDAVWSHIAVVVASSSVTFYLNGATDGTAVGAPGGDGFIMCNDNPSETFKGSLDDLYIDDRAMTGQEISSIYLSRQRISQIDTPLAYYRFDDGADGATASGATIRDYSGNGNTGTAQNSPTWTTTQLIYP